MPDRPLNVAIDARCLNVEHLRGMGKAVFELVRRTAESGAVRWHLLADRPDRPLRAPAHEAVAASVFETYGYRFHTWEQWSLPLAARRRGVNLLHAPATTAPWWQPVPTVVTVHDTIPWQQDDPAWPPGPYRDRVLPSAYHRAAAVLTISHTSRRDILARWPQLEPKLHVISLGVDERYLDARPDRRPIVIGDRVVREPYLLYLGGADARKRLLWALQAWWSCSTEGVSMIACGVEPGAHEALLQTVPREARDRLVLAPFIAEEEMPRLYMRAAAVLYPSLYEGFGLPVVEAQAVGTPVLFSDAGSLGELNGPGAVMLPVDDMQAWVRAIDLLLQSRRPADGPDRIARAWAGQYSWENHVQRTLEVYASVAAQPQEPHPHPTQQRATS
jgi:glycosyltransferase involved in cell wall biosynthesis